MNQGNPKTARRWTTALVLAGSLLLGGCAGSGPGQATDAASASADAPTAAAPTAVLPSPPLPAAMPAPPKVNATKPAPAANTIAINGPNAGLAIAGPLDLSCKVDADCTIKDIGSCCGYQPRCLNANSPTYAAQVKAKCAREGRVSTCGMLAITGCECVAGKCANITQSGNNGLLQ